MIINLIRVLELALRFPATRKVAFDATSNIANTISIGYNDTLDNIAWQIAREKHKTKQKENKENNEQSKFYS